jgi:uncharacterized protein (TIGR03435 family)
MYGMKLQTMRVNVCAGLALLTAGAVFGQTPVGAPAFEVASVKPAAPPANPGQLRVEMGGDPGMIDYKNVSLKTVIARAYRMKEFQISGPDWIETARFDILAKVPPNAPKGQIPPMLQNLLAERFKLTVHREQKVMPVYAMVVGKGGLMVKPMEGEPEGSMSNKFSPKGRAFSGQMTLSALAAALSQMLDRPVVDLSGIKGTYDIDLEWVPDEHESSALTKMRIMGGPAGGGAEAHGETPDPNGQSIFGALQEKLGLRLEGRKSPVDILVVDAAEKVPTEN